MDEATRERLSHCEPKFRLHSQHNATDVAMQVGVGRHVKTPYGSDVVIELATNYPSLVLLNAWTLANGESPTLSVGIPYHLDG
jgi:hypothetical protein